MLHIASRHTSLVEIFKLQFLQAKELGVRSVILDGPDSWSQTLVKEGLIEKFISIDFTDADTVFDQCLASIKKAQSVSLLTSQLDTL